MSRHVLLIDDDPSDRTSILEALMDAQSAPLPLERVASLAEALHRLSENSFPQMVSDPIAAIIVDLFLPDSAGIQTFDQLFRAAPHIPILVLTTSSDLKLAKLAVRHGAQEYLFKEHLDGDSVRRALDGMIERTAETESLVSQRELAASTLDCIGDAIISMNVKGEVMYLNAVAESMTGWRSEEAVGRPLAEVVRIINFTTRGAVANPLLRAMTQNRALGLTPECVLVRRDGRETGIEDSASPIHDRNGCVIGAVMVFRDVTQSRALALRTAHVAQHDALCGPANRALLKDRLSQAIAAAQRHSGTLAVLIVDMDRFKAINDSMGHGVGDQLLQAVAQRLLGCVRQSDTVGRLGGDEFVVVLSELSQMGDAVISADKLLAALRLPYAIADRTVHMTASIGIATFPDDGADAETLLANADMAMRHAKAAGRRQHQFYSKQMNQFAPDRLSLETGLRRALAQEELLLHYQPRVDLHTGTITGVESLVRWRHPEHGVVPAAPFIRVAEQSGLIVPIGRWVLSEACRQARAWSDGGLPPVPIAVNASATELADDGFVDHVRATLGTFDLEPRRLEIELTETHLTRAPGRMVAALQDLKRFGVQLAFDDFGTGHDSLSCLRRIPIDALKIDQSLVRELDRNGDDANIVVAMITLGRNLQLRVVAEGIETLRQLSFLMGHNCPEGQGYFFSRPVAGDECAALLHRRFAVGPASAHQAMVRGAALAD